MLYNKKKTLANKKDEGSVADEIYEAIKLRSLIDEALNSLTEKEALVLRLRFGLGKEREHTLAEIGKQLYLSAERIRQIEVLALRKLKHPIGSRKLKRLVEPIQERMEERKKDEEKIIEFPTDFNIGLITTNITEELIRYFAEHPDEMKTMNPRRLEEMIAELFIGFGYEVELTKQTRDGGRDVIAIKDSEVAEKFIIEAKRPKPGKPVGIVPVRALYGVKSDEKATKAILATTTHFTRDAIMFFKRHIWELEQKDYDGIMQWIKQYLKQKGE
ncbi:MAG: restriction endonuclease [Candidatus Hodarchaeota archaeon]